MSPSLFAETHLSLSFFFPESTNKVYFTLDVILNGKIEVSLIFLRKFKEQAFL